MHTFAMILTLALVGLPGVAGATLSLEEAVEQAVSLHERAQMADAEVEGAKARLAQARSRFFPSLVATGSYTRRAYQLMAEDSHGTSVPARRFNALRGELGLSTQLFSAPAIALYRQALRQHEALALEALEAKRQLALETALMFLEALSSQQVQQAAERRLGFAQQSLSDAQARAGAQLVGSNDVTKAQLELAVATSTLMEAQGQVKANHIQLEALLTQPMRLPLSAPTYLLTVSTAPLPSTEALVALAQARRLDLQSLEYLRQAALEGAREPGLRLIPNIGFSAQMFGLNEPASNAGHALDASASLILTWPLLDGGLRQAEAAERQVLVKQRVLQARILRRQVKVDVSAARVALLKMQSTLQQASQAVQAAQRNAQETRSLYRAGLANALAVEDASVRWFDAQVMQTRQQYGLAMGYVALRTAMGLHPIGKEALTQTVGGS